MAANERHDSRVHLIAPLLSLIHCSHVRPTMSAERMAVSRRSSRGSIGTISLPGTLMTGADDGSGRRILCVFPRYTSS
ncbi:MAG: hypothetical protein ACXW3X_10200, partial [Rhodoplanes sp.]